MKVASFFYTFHLSKMARFHRFGVFLRQGVAQGFRHSVSSA